jgi:hypothetical protein
MNSVTLFPSIWQYKGIRKNCVAIDLLRKQIF